MNLSPQTDGCRRPRHTLLPVVRTSYGLSPAQERRSAEDIIRALERELAPVEELARTLGIDLGFDDDDQSVREDAEGIRLPPPRLPAPPPIYRVPTPILPPILEYEERPFGMTRAEEQELLRRVEFERLAGHDVSVTIFENGRLIPQIQSGFQTIQDLFKP